MSHRGFTVQLLRRRRSEPFDRKGLLACPIDMSMRVALRYSVRNVSHETMIAVVLVDISRATDCGRWSNSAGGCEVKGFRVYHRGVLVKIVGTMFTTPRCEEKSRVMRF